ncbi:uncharacterized protein LOC132309263 [Cornus florida]|uniref:uncharacterized protein LOC132309263 n=1 Tax=Cornus florida TaxID=4283 RepID=UPI00289994D8|nr:uncharacterized protein LOC132309263 [Cornus florida]
MKRWNIVIWVNEQADGVEVGQNNEDESNEDEDYMYSFSSEDEDWNVNNGDGGLVDETTLRNKHGNRSDDGLSDYSSNDDCGYSSSDCDEDGKGDNVEEDDGEEGYYGKGLKGVIKRAIGHKPKRSQLYRTRGKAMDEVEGNHAALYGLLPQYANEIRKYNPGSTIFGVGWLSFEGAICGVLLAAIALDANNGLFPVAFGVVESERKDSWKFFSQHLSTVIEADTLDKPWTFMSDMQKGLDQALVETIPQATHRLCCRHLYNAFKRKHLGLMLQKKFWKLYAFNPDVKNDHVTNNISENFNNWVGDLRMKPLHSCLDGIRAKMMERIHKSYEQGCTWQGLVTPKVKKKLNNVIAEGRGFSVLVTGRGEFEVTDETCRHVVNFNARTCDCMGWQIAGLPCKHAAAAICYNREKIKAFCDSSYTIDTYMKIHEGIIHPIPDQQLWQPYTGILLEPPPPRRLPGRPRKNRKRDTGEAPKVVKRSYALRCMLCQRTGYNKRTYQRAPTRRELQEEVARENGGESVTPSSICKVSQGASQPRQTTQQRGKSQRRSGSVVPTTNKDKENACPSNAQTRGKGPQIGLPQTRKYIPVFA